MSEIIGRTGAKRNYSYPENSRAAALGLFARNFASGPEESTEITGGGIQIPWNAVESPIKFTINAGGVTVTIPGDARDSFGAGDSVTIVPLTPGVLAPVTGTVNSLPGFSSGVTTFDLLAAIDSTTTSGFIFDTTIGTVDVPITPRVTGVVLVSGVVTFKCKGDPVDLATIQVAVNGTAQPVPFDLQFGPFATGDSVTIPFMAELLPSPLGPMVVGTKAYIQIIVTGDTLNVLAEDAALEIQEISFATG